LHKAESVRVVVYGLLLATFVMATPERSVGANTDFLGSLLGPSADARATDEMLRGTAGRERRWMQRPNLVVVTTVMAFEEGARSKFTTVDARLSKQEADALVADLTAGLEVLSGGTFEHFGSVRFESPARGSQVRVVRDGDIVVGRFRGVRDSLKAVGYGGRTARANGTITGGTVMLDEDYDQSTEDPHLLRMHELGHALGFNHVDSLRSIMNPTIGTEPTEFDRRVARMAFSHIAPDRRAPALHPTAP
jgi:hypothetical protein